jgi:cytochrome P450
LNPTDTFPLGRSINIDDLDSDPYPVYSKLRDHEPVSRIDAFNLYMVTRYSDVQSILNDTETYVTGTEHSLIMDTFGEHMLTTEGELHDLYKNKVRSVFSPSAVRNHMEDAIRGHVQHLIDGFRNDGSVELRAAFAGRLPILSMLSLFGLPAEDEAVLRRWYDAFEKALANFTWDEKVRIQAHDNVAEFHHYLQQQIDSRRHARDGTLLEVMLHSPEGRMLDDAEIRRNASLIFFGGISTVEALIMNSVYSLLLHPDVLARVHEDHALIPRVLDETMRWMSPVQSATRHVTRDTVLHGVTFKAGDTVNCMLASANRDPDVFDNADVFDIDRPRLKRHVGFAMGAHHCLGSHLARLEARIALEIMLEQLPGFRMDPLRPAIPRGYEFRQPKSMHLEWDLHRST